MTDRERLVELLKNFTIEREIIDNHDNVKGFETFKVVARYCELNLADHLIANGVTVRKNGQWVMKDTAYGCSLCGHGMFHPWANYCPGCGAKMKEEAIT